MSQFEMTEEMFDSIAAPLAAAVGLGFLESQLDALLDVESELRNALAAWEPELRDRAARDLRDQITTIRRVLDRLETAVPEVQS